MSACIQSAATRSSSTAASRPRRRGVRLACLGVLLIAGRRRAHALVPEHSACRSGVAAERPAASSKRIAHFVATRGSAHDESAGSEERFFAEEQVVVTTKVCVVVEPPRLQKYHWYRLLGRKPASGMPRDEHARVDAHASACAARHGAHNASAHHGAWVEALHRVVPCTTPQRASLVAHDYCFHLEHMARFAPEPQPAAAGRAARPRIITQWYPGLTLLMSEFHTSNFNHFNRDAAFLQHALGVLNLPAQRILALEQREDLRSWGLDHMRAQLPAELQRQLIWVNISGMLHRPQLSALDLFRIADSIRAADARAHGGADARAPQLRPQVHLCFEALAQKYAMYSADRRAFDDMRARSYAFCHVSPGREPSYILFESRSHEPWEGGTRIVSNHREVRAALDRVAERFKLGVRIVTFGDMDYCGQVHAVAGARALVGVHGQGLTNAIFLRRGAALIELFSRHFTLRGPEALTQGHVPLALAANMQYAAGYVESTCAEYLHWKFHRECASIVNTTELEHVLLPQVLRAGSDMFGKKSAWPKRGW